MEKHIISVNAETVGDIQHLVEKRGAVYEIRDFADPQTLDKRGTVEALIKRYARATVPEGSLLFGAFHDLSIFSLDSKVRTLSHKRMRQSLDIARRLGVGTVLFYANGQPYLLDNEHSDLMVSLATDILKDLLGEFPEIQICLENRFEEGPELFGHIALRMKEYDNLRFCLNYCRAALSPVIPEYWASALGDRIVYLRIFDPDLQEVVPGQDDDLEVCFQRHRSFSQGYCPAAGVIFSSHQLRGTPLATTGERKAASRQIQRGSKMASYEGTPEGMLEKIFFYMNQLVGEKGFSSTILLLTDMGRTLANSERASFWYWDTHKRKYWTIVALGRDRIEVEEGTGIIGASIKNNEVLIINDPYSDDRFYPQVDIASGFTTRSILCIPVTDSKGRVIGAFQAINKLTEEGYGSFDEHDVKRLTMAAAYCGRTLETYLLYQETLLDALTRLKNRRGFWEYYEEHLRTNGSHQSAAIVLCDIDFFKSINDTHGHAAGDAVLVAVAAILQEEVGSQGEAIRWGGEEFILLLRNHDLAAAARLSDKIRTKLMETPIPFQRQLLGVTMSFGVAEIDPQLTIEKNVAIADKKLYQAKENGRNQVVC